MRDTAACRYYRLETLVWAGWCVLSVYSAFVQLPPAIKQKLHLNDFFPPLKAAVTGCYLLDLCAACRFRTVLTDWQRFSFFFHLSSRPSLPLAYLIAC